MADTAESDWLDYVEPLPSRPQRQQARPEKVLPLRASSGTGRWSWGLTARLDPEAAETIDCSDLTDLALQPPATLEAKSERVFRFRERYQSVGLAAAIFPFECLSQEQ